MGWPKGIKRGPRHPVNDGQPEGESNMSEKQVKPETVTMTKEQFDALMGRVDSLEKKSKGPGIETTAMRMEKNYREINKTEDINQVRKAIMVKDEAATIDSVMLHDKCPFCIKYFAGLPTILDQTKGGKYACRRCGKHWSPWAIEPEDGSEGPLAYNILLERNGGDREAYAQWVKDMKHKQLQEAKG